MHSFLQKTPTSRPRLRLALLCGLILAAAAAFQARRLLADPTVILLMPKDGSQWIQFDRPFSLFVWHHDELNTTYFRTDFQIPPHFSGAVLQIRALRELEVFLDGHLLFDTGPAVTNWKQTYHIPLPPSLNAGPHRLDLKVTNLTGPCLTWVYIPELNLHSDTNWQARTDGSRWRPAALADALKNPRLEFEFNSCATDVAARFPLLLILFIAGFCATLYVQRAASVRDWVRWLRWGMLLAWTFIAINNLIKLPFYTGYDVVDHYNYIHFIVEKHRVPLPNEGWEFFQTPFFYLIGALFYRAMQLASITPETADQLLRIIPLLCCIGIIEVCYRSARLIFPNRRASQAVAMVVGGFLPMLFYMAPEVSNQQLASLLDSLIVFFSFRLLVNPAAKISLAREILFGVILGLAVLTKVTAVIWIPPLFLALAIALHYQHAGFLRWLRSAAIVLLMTALICSWYCIRNWIVLGQPFLAASKIGAFIALQDPGFRTPHQLLEFGRVFTHPVYSGLNSVWDSLYDTMWADGFISGNGSYQFRPPWNFSLMSCGLWLSVFPMAAILAGVIRNAILTLRWIIEPQKNIETQSDQPNRLAPYWFAILGIACFLGAIAHEYLRNPMYSYGKASYMLGAAPCFAVLAAAGFNMLPNHRIIRSIAAGLLFCWAATAYLTYWIV